MDGTTIEERTPEGLAALEAALARDLDYLCRPPANWVPPRRVGEETVSDVVIIGGGMCGLVAWFALQTGGVRNIRILDRNPSGLEGPWVTYARMETLRSPKTLVGPAFGMSALTFRAWFTAQFGETAWEALDKIPRPMWMDYLRWYRKALDVPIENEVNVDKIDPEGPYLRLTISGAGANQSTILARKVVMATGRDGIGRANIPSFVDGVSRDRWAHSSDDIDFDALAGKRVAVVGVGASAVDNAAEALEHGAKEVRHLIRRAEMPTINKLMGIGSYGFSCGFPELPDEWRWRIMHYAFAMQTPAPRGSTLRVSRHPNAYFHFGKAITRVETVGEALAIDFADGTRLDTDFLILGTGFTVEAVARKELADVAGEILLWKDRYTPPADEQHAELGNFPYLNKDFTFRERTEGVAPWLSNIYCFNHAASLSLGKVSGDIPGVSDGASWLARDIAATLYVEDIENQYTTLLDYSKPELQGDEWTASAFEPVLADETARS
ncbi:NAD(P)/FAD-dependent oxidoreductase [Acuticoccus sp. M5D2P5]|uniref:NAD(P)-binding domain-containing protein n=1 Tax=Acuticoccus kalidii TaxID=2910977 RepID=UPI001F472179|nr:NAD(P)/FAD-dependent oxidoreductase [Acuticoccus kalidii]MCF3934533.1 NAD(P)/FAD-dependent oxidoreductase [Acuticoccus kalidii]